MHTYHFEPFFPLLFLSLKLNQRQRHCWAAGGSGARAIGSTRVWSVLCEPPSAARRCVVLGHEPDSGPTQGRASGSIRANRGGLCALEVASGLCAFDRDSAKPGACYARRQDDRRQTKVGSESGFQPHALRSAKKNKAGKTPSMKFP